MKDIRENIKRFEEYRERMRVEGSLSVDVSLDVDDINQIIHSLKTNNAIESVLDEELEKKLRLRKIKEE